MKAQEFKIGQTYYDEVQGCRCVVNNVVPQANHLELYYEYPNIHKAEQMENGCVPYSLSTMESDESMILL